MGQKNLFKIIPIPFHGISTFVAYLMPKPGLQKNSINTFWQ